MKIYIASTHKCIPQIEKLVKYLVETEGHEIIVKWWVRNLKKEFAECSDDEWFSLPQVKEWRERNFENIEASDAVIMVYPDNRVLNMNGACVEVGYATAKGILVYAIGIVPRSAMLSSVIRVSCFTELGRLLSLQERGVT